MSHKFYGLTTNQRRIIEVLENNQQLTTKEICEKTKIERNNIYKYFKLLRSRKIIVKVDNKWCLNE